MSWFRLKLMRGTLDPALVEESWKLLWDVSRHTIGAGPGSALFGVYGSEDLTLYFTPSAKTLATTFGATPCGRPAPEGLKFIAGDEPGALIHFGMHLPEKR